MGCTWLEVFSRYERYISILKWGSFVLLAYVAVALVVPVPWDVVFYSTFVPSFSLKTDYVVTVVAVLGTTITPYCFFWQSSQEAEDQRVDPRMRRHLHWDGLFERDKAAEALRPIAGVFTFALFAAGIIGIGLLAVPVLAASGAYALGEALGWTTGLDRKPLDAKAFYVTIAISTLIGVGINFVGLDPIKALFWSAVINGVVAVPLMVIIMLMAMREDVMGDFVLPRALWAMGWLSTATMAVVVAIMFATW